MKRTRRLVQLGFLALTLVGVFVVGGNCERWCPFGGVEALATYVAEGDMLCSLGTANFFILGGLLLATVLVRRAFCSYICPIGALSEWLNGLGRRLRLPLLRIPARPDRALALLKYAVLAAILWLTWETGELVFRGFDPCYALISRHGTDITAWAYVASAAVALVSLVVVLPFCRWVCPLAAVLNPFSRFGVGRVNRDDGACRNCGLCEKHCPTQIPVDQLRQVTAARCTSCLNCLDACPHAQSHAISWGPFGWKWSQATVVAVLLTCASAAVAASYAFPLPSFVKTQGSRPPQTAEAKLEIEGVTCRGRANLLWYFLERDDLCRVPGYFRVEAWPGPGSAEVHVLYDPAATSEEAICRAITQPYYDVLADFWRMSPFRVEGYDPLGLGPEDAAVLP